MLSIQEIKELLGNDKISDGEAEEIRHYCYRLAELALENLKLINKNKVFTFASQTIIIKA